MRTDSGIWLGVSKIYNEEAVEAVAWLLACVLTLGARLLSNCAKIL